MEDKDYSLVFEGTVMPGFARREVIDRVARRMGKDPKYLRRLFRDKPVTVKKGMDRQKALDQQRAFSKMGVRCHVWPEPGAPHPEHYPDHGHSQSRQGCPKCGSNLTKFGTEMDDCPFCGIIISKYIQIRRR